MRLTKVAFGAGCASESAAPLPIRKTRRGSAATVFMKLAAGCPMFHPIWGGSSAGRASRSQCEGREFDPPPLHQINVHRRYKQDHKPRRQRGFFWFLVHAIRRAPLTAGGISVATNWVTIAPHGQIPDRNGFRSERSFAVVLCAQSLSARRWCATICTQGDWSQTLRLSYSGGKHECSKSAVAASDRVAIQWRADTSRRRVHSFADPSKAAHRLRILTAVSGRRRLL